MKFRHYLHEVSFVKTLRMSRGDIPYVNRLGIITSDNPHGVAATPEQSSARRVQLLRDIQMANVSSVQVKSPRDTDRRPRAIPTGGNFGSIEQSFIIPHITRGYASELGRRYGQKAIIWGQKMTRPDGNESIRFEYIEHLDADPDNYHTTQTRDVVLSGSDLEKQSIADEPHLYSGRKMGKGEPNKDTKKFLVPFFDDRYAQAEYSADRRRIETQAETFYLPFFDDVMAGRVPTVEVFGEINFESKDFPDNDLVREIAKDVKQREAFLYRDTIGMAAWGNRGGLNESLRDLRKLVELLLASRI